MVADRIETDRARKLEALWHWHPRRTMQVEGGTVVSTDADAGNLRIVPVAGFNRQAGCLPFRIAVFQPPDLVSFLP